MNHKSFQTLISILLIVVISSSLILSASARADYDDDNSYFGQTEASVDAKTVPYVTYLGEGRQESEFTLYFVDGGDIPYVAVSDFLPLFAEILNMGAEDDAAPVAYTVYGPADNPFGEHYYLVGREDNDSLMYINTLKNTIEFSNFNAFVQAPGASGLVSVMDLPDTDVIDYSELAERLLTAESEEEMEAIQEEMITFPTGKENAMFRLATTVFNRAGNVVSLNLTNYLIDIVETEGECYVPLQTFADLFTSPCYVLFIYNGDKLYGFSFPLNTDLVNELYEKEPEKMSDDFAFFNYNELRFLLDTNYGLKSEHDITDFGLFLLNSGLVPGLTSTNSRVFDNAVTKLTTTYFDDGHSAFVNGSWRSGRPDDITSLIVALFNMGPSSMISFNARQQYSEARDEAYPDGAVPMYEEVGDTAFITFDSFYIGESDVSAYYDPELVLDPETFVIRQPDMTALFDEEGEEAPPAEELPVDTVKLFLYAYQMITRENSPIQNVVIDLSNNGGGHAAAAVFVIDFVIGKANIAVKDVFTGAETVMSYRADVNRDNLYFGIGDSLLNLGKNVYCLISPNSFSCGNLVPAAFKMSQCVTLVGQTSGGGSCVVLPCTSASGAVFQISGNKQLSLIRNGSFYNIDQGIEPDIYLSKPSSFYERESLAAYLRDLK